MWLKFLVVDFIGKDRSDFIHSLAKCQEGKDYKISSMRTHTLSSTDLQKLIEETQDGDLEPMINAFWGTQKSKYVTHESDYWEFDVDKDLQIQFWHMPTEPLTKDGLSSEYINSYIELFLGWAEYYIFIIPVQKPELFPQIKALINAMKDIFDTPAFFIIPNKPKHEFDDKILYDNLDLPTQVLIQECDISETQSTQKVFIEFLYFILDILESDNKTTS